MSGIQRVNTVAARGVTRSRSGLLAVAMVLLGVAVLAIDRDMRLFHDEWWYVCGRSLGDIASLLRPHNEHWVTIHVVAYRLLLDTFGLDSYLPFLFLLLAAHAAVAAAVLRLTGSILATLVMVFFGAGYENLFWAFQSGFVGGLAFGLWALVAFVENRRRAGAVLLLFALATAGSALFAIPAIALYLLLNRRVADMVWMFPALIAYAVWAALSRGEMVFLGGTSTAEGVLTFVALGLVSALGFGSGPIVAAGNAALLVAARPGRPSPLVLASLAALASMFVFLAVTRSQFSPSTSRYLYAAAPFALLAFVGFARDSRRPIAVHAVLAIALVTNLVLLVSIGARWPEDVAKARAEGSDIPPAFVCLAEPGVPIRR